MPPLGLAIHAPAPTCGPSVRCLLAEDASLLAREPAVRRPLSRDPATGRFARRQHCSQEIVS